MNKLLKYILIFFLYSYPLFSQGFNWQYSSRLPSDYPNIFVGANAGYSTVYDIGEFTFTEEAIECCLFDYGRGFGIKVGFAAEYWFENGNDAICINLNYNIRQSEFTTRHKLLTVQYPVTYEFVYESAFNNLVLEALYKKRIMNSHFSVLGGFAVEVLTSQKNEYKHHILSPESEYFTDGSKERTISEGNIAPLKSLIFNPIIATNYDFNLGKSRYGSIGIFTELPLSNILSDETWRKFEFGINFKILFGIK